MVGLSGVGEFHGYSTVQYPILPNSVPRRRLQELMLRQVASGAPSSANRAAVDACTKLLYRAICSIFEMRGNAFACNSSRSERTQRFSCQFPPMWSWATE